MKNRICTKFALCKPVANIKFAKVCTIAYVVVAKFAQNVQTWQPPLLQWVKTYTKSIFATGLHKANFVEIRFFIQCDVDSAVNAARRFFLTEVDSKPENDPTAKLWSRKEQKEYLDGLSSNIVDKYIVDKEKHEKITAAVEQLEERQPQRLKDKTANGRYRCRYPGCKKTFSNDGNWRMMHERAHNPPVSIAEQPILEDIYSGYTVADDMYNYRRALLEYGMVIINFLDAISEGDGARLLRNWKFLLLYFQHDTGSQKYSL